MKTYLMIVIDQLRFDDAVNLTRLNSVLGRPSLYKTTVFPTLTETVHATIATGLPSSTHGIVGSGWFADGASGLEHCDFDRAKSTRPTCEAPYDKIHFKRLLVRQLFAASVESFVVAGKRKVARLLAPRIGGNAQALRATFEPVMGQTSDWKLQFIDHLSSPSKKRNTSRFPKNFLDPIPNLKSVEADDLLIKVMRHLLEKKRDPSKHAFAFLGLPRLDLIGHYKSRTSIEFKTALAEIDTLLSGLIDWCVAEFSENFKCVVTSDHGYRDVSSCVVPVPSDSLIHRFDKNPNSYTKDALPDELRSAPRKQNGGVMLDLPAIIADGGTLRCWVKSRKKKSLSTKIRSSSIYGCSKVELKSKHANFGHLFGQAEKDVALCKEEWLLPPIDWSSKHPAILQPVVAEHGTFFDEDRQVPWWGEPCVGHDGLLAEVLEFFISPV